MKKSRIRSVCIWFDDLLQFLFPFPLCHLSPNIRICLYNSKPTTWIFIIWILEILYILLILKYYESINIIEYLPWIIDVKIDKSQQCHYNNTKTLIANKKTNNLKCLTFHTKESNCIISPIHNFRNIFTIIFFSILSNLITWKESFLFGGNKLLLK